MCGLCVCVRVVWFVCLPSSLMAVYVCSCVHVLCVCVCVVCVWCVCVRLVCLLTIFINSCVCVGLGVVIEKVECSFSLH